MRCGVGPSAAGGVALAGRAWLLGKGLAAERPSCPGPGPPICRCVRLPALSRRVRRRRRRCRRTPRLAAGTAECLRRWGPRRACPEWRHRSLPARPVSALFDAAPGPLSLRDADTALLRHVACLQLRILFGEGAAVAPPGRRREAEAAVPLPAAEQRQLPRPPPVLLKTGLHFVASCFLPEACCLFAVIDHQGLPSDAGDEEAKVLQGGLSGTGS